MGNIPDFVIVIFSLFIGFILFKKIFYNKDIYIVDIKLITKYKDKYCDEIILSSEYFSKKEYAHAWANYIVDNKTSFDKWLNEVTIYSFCPSNLHEKLYEAKNLMKKSNDKFVADSVNISYTVTHKVMRK